MISKPSRRQFLKLIACSSALIATPFDTLLAKGQLYEWRGIVFGTNVRLLLAHTDKAQNIAETCMKEVKRLENILTLYDKNSQLSQLNKYKEIENADPALLDIIKLSKEYHGLSNGYFDITAQAKTDDRFVKSDINDIKIKGVRIHIPTDMELSLNGIGQGFITDKASEILKQQGLDHVLIELGETKAIGTHPLGDPWHIGIEHHDLFGVIDIENEAIATSSTQNDIINPHTAKRVEILKTVSVKAKTAALADAMATAHCAAPDMTIPNHPSYEVITI